MEAVPREVIDRFYALNPEVKDRAHMNKTIAILVGITPEQAYQANCLRRSLQRILPIDQKGEELEQKWRSDNGMASIFELAQGRSNQLSLIH